MDSRSLFGRQKEHFFTDVTKTLAWRVDQLDRLERLLLENEAAFREALGKDVKTAWFEPGMEYYASLGSVADATAHLGGDLWLWRKIGYPGRAQFCSELADGVSAH